MPRLHPPSSGDDRPDSELDLTRGAPGKRSASEALPVQRKASAPVAAGAAPRPPAPGPLDDPFGLHLIATPVQRRLADAVDDPATIAAAAAHGTSGPGTSLPHGDVIQRAFGHHDVSGVRAHTDEAAAQGARAMGALGFATGDHVAFAGPPDLHTAAHEAAHVVQQRGGVSLKGGVGAAGDVYEQHADQVADAVVAGRPAESLLDGLIGPGAGGPAVQRRLAGGLAIGTPIRQVSTGRTGTIAGAVVWAKYPVRWDDGGRPPQVALTDDDFEVAAATATTSAPAPAVETTTPAPAVETTTPAVEPTTPAVVPTTPAVVAPAPARATGGKQPDRGISEDDDAWREQWAAKQDEVYRALQAFVPRFLALDAAAEVRIRGSIATGVKANPAKVHPETGERLLFNPTDFDIDAYVASDVLYQQALTSSGSSDAAVRGKIPGSKLPAVNAIIRDMRRALARIAGNRDAPRDVQYRFNVIIRSFRNDAATVRQDQADMGAPLTVEPPEAD